MFVYLSKKLIFFNEFCWKIAIPNNTRLNCISWNRDQGYVAVGGDDGLLKVLKLEAATQGGQARGGLAAPSNLSMNQTLDGHKASVQVVTWNETQQKLTTSDRDGVIMVWMLYKGSWYEEMTNDRKKSTVKGMSWTRDGQKICIVYEDGAIIVGSVDGNRIWGKELKGTPLTGVQWSPDGRLLLFSVRSGELHLYDNQGAFVMRLSVQCVNLGPSRAVSIAACVWFTGPAPTNRPVLAILYENGKMQLMRNENDDLPIIVDTQMQAISCQWNHDGSILAVCGMKTSMADKESNQAMFYSAYGVHLRTLKVPGREVTSLSWEGRSLRIAFGVDSFIYFANIRPDYMWCSFGRTVAFLQADSGRDGAVFTFWDTASNQCFSKTVDVPLCVAASADHCVIAVEAPRLASRDANVSVETNFGDHPMFQLLVCNSMSTTVDSRYIDLWPHFVGMNSTHVVVASKEQFLLWPYRTPKGVSALPAAKSKRERRFHVDDTPSGVAEVLNDLDRSGFEVPSASELAVAIFSRHEPKDTQPDRASCFTCEALVPDASASCPHCGTRFPACVASGRALVNPTDAWLCSVCHHLASPAEIATRRSCPLCHGLIGATSSGARDKSLQQIISRSSTSYQQVINYHFLLLAQRQLKSGLMHSAVLTSLRLREYENVLDPEEIYGLLALASCADRSFGTASRAFIKLEALESLPEPRRAEYEELAVAIFSRHEPKDTQPDRASCFTCEALVPDASASCPHCGTRFPACVASGRALVNPTDAWLCSVCHHLASPAEIATRRSCPLCHGLIGATSSGARDSTDL
uniref:Uncharacterized protein n=1 Tax=Lutzomyia longipalpis TaxID=7200 RepID=A0A1B0CRZ4_LUTLO